MDNKRRAQRAQVVLSEYDGIFPPYEAFYLQAVVYAAGRSVEAFARFDAAVERAADAAVTVACVHEALTHAAAVSRYFWPAGKGKVTIKRGERFRQSFQLTEESPLFDRSLRNGLEHFDERLDEFLLEDLVGAIFPGAMIEDAEIAGENGGKVFRLVDPVKAEVVLLGQRYHFGPVRKAVDAVLQLAEEMDRRGGRLSKPI